jgi:GTPase SAR1 family protein
MDLFSATPFKILLCGPKNAGKSTLITRLHTGTFPVSKHDNLVQSFNFQIRSNYGVMLFKIIEIADYSQNDDIIKYLLDTMDISVVMFDITDRDSIIQAYEYCFKLAKFNPLKPIICLANKYDGLPQNILNTELQHIKISVLHNYNILDFLFLIIKIFTNITDCCFYF